jgi:hypothetical protein
MSAGLLVVASIACGRVSSSPTASASEAGASASSTPPSSPAQSANQIATSADVPTSQPPVDDVPALTYRPYANARFGFVVDVPTFFRPSRPPTNGDGQEWTWGAHATMTASGMNNAASLTTQDLCKDDFAKRHGATAKSITATTCFVSGRDAGKIYWEKTRLAGDVIHSLRFAYDESLKQPFDPLLTHVDASWKTPRSAPQAAASAASPPQHACTPGWIDECGGCYQPCDFEHGDRDCKVRGQTCQPIVCAHGSYGSGCVAP